MTIVWTRWQPISDSSSSVFHDMLKPLVVIAILVVLILFSSEVFVGLFSFTRLISTRGNLQHTPNIAIYQDSNCTSPVSYIDWGSLAPGMTQNIMMYVRNEGKAELGLYLESMNWQPLNITHYLNLTWDYQNTLVLPGETLRVTLNLSSSSSPEFMEYLVAHDIAEFSFDIVISAFS